MGAKYVAPNASSYPADSVFKFGDRATFTYRPTHSEFSVRRGVLEPPEPVF